MKAIILAAGRGERMMPLTRDMPKPLLMVAGKTVLGHIFEALPEEIDEAIIVVKYLGEKIRAYCGDNFHGRKIQYAEGNIRGNAFSFLAAHPFVEKGERIMILYGDEIPSRKNMEKCLEYRYSWLCKETARPQSAGVARFRRDGTIEEIAEKSLNPPSHIAVIGLMVMGARVFDFLPEQNQNGEYYLTSILNKFLKEEKVYAVLTRDGSRSLTSPADIPIIEEFLEKSSH